MEPNKLEIYQAAADYLQSIGCDAEVRSDYSGRFMYGKEVPAIVTDASGPMVGEAVALACSELDIDPRGIAPGRSDSMGLSMVYY